MFYNYLIIKITEYLVSIFLTLFDFIHDCE